MKIFKCPGLFHILGFYVRKQDGMATGISGGAGGAISGRLCKSGPYGKWSRRRILKERHKSCLNVTIDEHVDEGSQVSKVIYKVKTNAAFYMVRQGGFIAIPETWETSQYLHSIRILAKDTAQVTCSSV